MDGQKIPDFFGAPVFQVFALLLGGYRIGCCWGWGGRGLAKRKTETVATALLCAGDFIPPPQPPPPPETMPPLIPVVIVAK